MLKQGENKDEDTVIKMIKAMGIGEHEPTCKNIGLEEETSHCTFL